MSKQEKLLAMKPWPTIDYKAHSILGLWTFEEVRILELMTPDVLISTGHGGVFQMGHSVEQVVEGTAPGEAWPWWPREASESFLLRWNCVSQVPSQQSVYCEILR